MGASARLTITLNQSVAPRENFFEPTHVKVGPGQTLTIRLENPSGALHTFTIVSPAVNQDVRSEGTEQVTVTMPQQGDVAFFCRLHVFRQPGMWGCSTLVPHLRPRRHHSEPALSNSTGNPGVYTSVISLGPREEIDMRPIRILALLCALVLTAVACADDGTTPTTGGTDSTNTSSPAGTSSPINNMGTADVTTNGSFTMELDDQYFKPTTIKAKPGQALNIEFENEGAVEHNFTIDSISGVDYTVPPGGKSEQTFTLPATPGTEVAFYCRFHVQAGMRGSFFFGASPASTGTTTNDNGGYTTPY